MAKGTVEGKYIKVTGFTPSENEEQIYKVVASGTSTAESTNGAVVESNVAVVKHEKIASITLESGAEPCDGYNFALSIQTINIQPGTLTVASFPEYISEFTISGYKLCYNLYPNYYSGETSGNCISVAGKDIYGNIISSNCIAIEPGDPVEKGWIDLTPEGPTTLDPEDTSCSFTFSLSPSPKIKEDTIETYELSGGISWVELDVTGHTLTVHFPPNTSRNYPKTYTISLTGEDEYGRRVYSNSVTISQKESEKSVDFYLTGDDISWDETAATFHVNFEAGKILTDTIEVTQKSSNITNNPQVEGLDIRVTTNQNDGAEEKILSITVTAKTVGGNEVLAVGSITQSPGVFLVVVGDDSELYTAYTSTTETEANKGVRTIVYASKNVNDITAEFVGGGDYTEGYRIDIITLRKNAILTLGINTTALKRKYKVKIKGKSLTGDYLEATYEFEQGAPGGFAFELYSGDTVTRPHEATIPYDQTSIVLKITHPKNYSNIGVSLLTSNSKIRRINSIEINESATELTGTCTENKTFQELVYTIQLSATTKTNEVVFSNVFKITHKNDKGGGGEIYFTSSGATVGASVTTCSIDFAYQNLTNIFVSGSSTSDNSFVWFDTPVFSNGTGQVVSHFTAYPPSGRTISVSLGGVDVANNEYHTELPIEYFVITQAGSGAGISVEPAIVTADTVTVPYTIPSYLVTFNNINMSTIGAIYDNEVFKNVTPAGAEFVDGFENSGLTILTYTITFYGQSLLDGEDIFGLLTVVVPMGDCMATGFTIESDRRYYNYNTDAYDIPFDGGTYPIHIFDSDELNYETLQGDRDNEIATWDMNSITVTFTSADSGSQTEPLTGRVEGDVAYLPVGNMAAKYLPKILEITKDDPDKLNGNTYEYSIEIDPYIATAVTNVWMEAMNLCGEEVSSNTLTFYQIGSPRVGPEPVPPGPIPAEISIEYTGGEVSYIAGSTSAFVIRKSQTVTTLGYSVAGPQWAAITDSGQTSVTVAYNENIGNTPIIYTVYVSGQTESGETITASTTFKQSAPDVPPVTPTIDDLILNPYLIPNTAHTLNYEVVSTTEDITVQLYVFNRTTWDYDYITEKTGRVGSFRVSNYTYLEKEYLVKALCTNYPSVFMQRAATQEQMSLPEGIVDPLHLSFPVEGTPVYARPIHVHIPWVYNDLPTFYVSGRDSRIWWSIEQGGPEYLHDGIILVSCSENTEFLRRTGEFAVRFRDNNGREIPEYVVVTWTQEAPLPTISWDEETIEIPAYREGAYEYISVIAYQGFQYYAVKDVLISADEEVESIINSGVTPAYVELRFPPNKTLSPKTWNVRIIGTAFNEGVEDVYDDLTVIQSAGVTSDFYFPTSVEDRYKYTKTVQPMAQFSEYIIYNGANVNFSGVKYEFINQGNLQPVAVYTASTESHYREAFIILKKNTTNVTVKSSFKLFTKDVYGDERTIEVEYIQPSEHPITLELIPIQTEIPYYYKQGIGIEISSNTAWTLSCEADWAILGLTGGTGNETTQLYIISQNKEIAPRTLTIVGETVGGELSTSVDITQQGAPPEILLVPDTWAVEYTGGTITVTITSNIDWELSSNREWATLSKTNGHGDDIVEILFDANETLVWRSVEITAIGEGIEPVVISPGQDKRPTPAIDISVYSHRDSEIITKKESNFYLTTEKGDALLVANTSTGEFINDVEVIKTVIGGDDDDICCSNPVYIGNGYYFVIIKKIQDYNEGLGNASANLSLNSIYFDYDYTICGNTESFENAAVPRFVDTNAFSQIYLLPNSGASITSTILGLGFDASQISGVSENEYHLYYFDASGETIIKTVTLETEDVYGGEMFGTGSGMLVDYSGATTNIEVQENTGNEPRIGVATVKINFLGETEKQHLTEMFIQDGNNIRFGWLDNLNDFGFLQTGFFAVDITKQTQIEIDRTSATIFFQKGIENFVDVKCMGIILSPEMEGNYVKYSATESISITFRITPKV